MCLKMTSQNSCISSNEHYPGKCPVNRKSFSRQPRSRWKGLLKTSVGSEHSSHISQKQNKAQQHVLFHGWRIGNWLVKQSHHAIRACHKLALWYRQEELRCCLHKDRD
jgi:hypothetical protein